jgi:hypothetical protein
MTMVNLNFVSNVTVVSDANEAGGDQNKIVVGPLNMTKVRILEAHLFASFVPIDSISVFPPIVRIFSRIRIIKVPVCCQLG